MALYEGRKLSPQFVLDIRAWTAPILERVSAYFAARSLRQTKDADIEYLRHLNASQLQDIGVDVKMLMSDEPDIKAAKPVDGTAKNFDPSRYSGHHGPHVLRGHIFVDLGRPPV